MQFFRNTEYIGYGSAKFLKHGLPEKMGVDLEDVDLKGRAFMITGANSGVGFCTSQYLATRGGTVHLVCSSDENAFETKRRMAEITSNPNVHIHICDLSEREDIENLVAKIKDQKYKIDVLVNNAAIMNLEKQLNSDGVEVTFATNLLSNFLLTTLLIPVLLNSNDPRVIFVSSGAGLSQKLIVDPEFSTLKEWDESTAFSVTKRQQIALCEKFAWEYSDSHIKFFSMHPGWVDGPYVQTAMPEVYKTYHKNLRWKFELEHH
jgi:dehydrogenase/reductase SDR family protein 12